MLVKEKIEELRQEMLTATTINEACDALNKITAMLNKANAALAKLGGNDFETALHDDLLDILEEIIQLEKEAAKNYDFMIEDVYECEKYGSYSDQVISTYYAGQL